MAYVVGVGLIILVLIGVPLQLVGHPGVVAVVGPIHGIFYIVYLLAAYDLARRARFTLLQMAAMVGAGLLPFLAFVLERRITRRIRQEVLGAVDPPPPPGWWIAGPRLRSQPASPSPPGPPAGP